MYNVLLGSSACNDPGYTTTKPCDSCQANLGIFSTYKTKYLQAIGVPAGSTLYDADIHIQYAQDSLACASACGALNINLTSLQSLRNQLLHDMVPYTGQYALEKDSIKNAAGAFDSTRLEAKHNIFTHTYTTPTGVVTIKPYYYRFPKDEAGADSDYFTEDNHVDLTIEPVGANDRSVLNNISATEYVNLFSAPGLKV